MYFRFFIVNTTRFSEILVILISLVFREVLIFCAIKQINSEECINL